LKLSLPRGDDCLSGEVALLCKGCNTGKGLFGDSAKLIGIAAGAVEERAAAKAAAAAAAAAAAVAAAVTKAGTEKSRDTYGDAGAY
jgi:hypothetical protein